MQKGIYETPSTGFIADYYAYLDCLQLIDKFGSDALFNNTSHYVPIIVFE
jgi:hypothetical protein